MTVINPADFYHTGIVVADLDAASKAMTAATGVTWRPERHVTVQTVTAGGMLTLPFRMLYSVQGPPFIELIADIPGTIWSAGGGGTRLHHIGYWAENVAAESARLEDLGLPREGGDGVPGGYPENFSYHSANGIYIELISAAGRASRFPDVYQH